MKKLLLDPAGILIFLAFSALAWSYYIANESNILVLKSPDKVIQVEHGGVVESCRTIKILRKTRLTLSKSIIQEVDSNKIVMVYLPIHSLKVNKGVQIVCNKTKLPDIISEGKWFIKAFIDIKGFPFWTKTMELPDIHISVKE